MIVPGIVFRQEGMFGNNPQARLPRTSALSTAEIPSSQVAEDQQITPGSGWTKTEPIPFILVGGLPAIFGTTIFSSPVVQEWVRGVLGWDEPTINGNPIAY